VRSAVGARSAKTATLWTPRPKRWGATPLLKGAGAEAAANLEKATATSSLLKIASGEIALRGISVRQSVRIPTVTTIGRRRCPFVQLMTIQFNVRKLQG